MNESRGPGSASGDDLRRLVIEAELCLAGVDEFASEVRLQVGALEPAAGRMGWHSEAARRFDDRVVMLRERLSAAVSALDSSHYQLEGQLRTLRALADAEAGILWPTN